MWKSFLSKTEEEEEELIVSKSDFNRYVRFFNMKARRRNERRNKRKPSQPVSQSDSFARLRIRRSTRWELKSREKITTLKYCDKKQFQTKTFANRARPPPIMIAKYQPTSQPSQANPEPTESSAIESSRDYYLDSWCYRIPAFPAWLPACLPLLLIIPSNHAKSLIRMSPF